MTSDCFWPHDRLYDCPWCAPPSLQQEDGYDGDDDLEAVSLHRGPAPQGGGGQQLGLHLGGEHDTLYIDTQKQLLWLWLPLHILQSKEEAVKNVHQSTMK